MSTNIIVQCFSGGLDSTVLLYHLKERGYDVHCLSVDYGQRHARELWAANQVRMGVGISPHSHKILNLRSLASDVLQGSCLTEDAIAVPEGHYEEESMKATVVPNRNMILLSLATAWCVSLKGKGVAYAAHAGDHAIYPDCRPVFANAMHNTMILCDWSSPDLMRPFIGMSKADIVKRGAELKVPFELTYSCYKGGERHCGRCSTCVERREAFLLSGVDDPTTYDDPDYFKTVIKS